MIVPSLVAARICLICLSRAVVNFFSRFAQNDRKGSDGKGPPKLNPPIWGFRSSIGHAVRCERIRIRGSGIRAACRRCSI